MPFKHLPSPWFSMMILASGGFCVVLGLIVLVGWHTQFLPLIHMLPTSPPMYYNTALGFVLSGAGVLALEYDRRLLANVCGGLIVILALATLHQYLWGVDLGVDQLVMEDIFHFTSKYPGRMAPTTAICLALSGAALLLVGGQAEQREAGPTAGAISDSHLNAQYVHGSQSRSALLEFFGVILIVSGLMTCTLYLLGVMAAFTWGAVANMAVPTAAGFSVLGVGILASAWRAKDAIFLVASPWLPVLVGVAIFTAALLLSQALFVQEHRQIERTIAAVASGIRTELTGHVDTRLLTLTGMAQRWAYAGAPLRDQWEFEAEVTLQGFPGYQSIAWVDPLLQVRWQVAHEIEQTRETLQNVLSPYTQTLRQMAQRESSSTTVLSSVDLGQGDKGFVVIVPLRQAQVFEGFIVGVFVFHDFLETLFKNIAPGYAVAVFDGSEEVYRRGPVGGQAEQEWGHETIIDPYGVTWWARVWPLPEELYTKQSALPEVTLGAGLAMATLLAWMVALAQTSRRRARDVETSYIRLTWEMSERQRAEEELRQAHGELELRVQQRTAELAQANAELRRENGERGRAEEALARQAKELARSNHELEHFAHVASHDLQEPLRKILAFGDRLAVQCGRDLNSQGLDYLKRMQLAATRMQTLINDLLTFSRVGTRPRPFVPVDLSAVAQTIVSDMEVSIQKVNGIVQIDNLPTIDADPVQMGQLLQNLISNALKFHRVGAPPIVKIRSAILSAEESDGSNANSPQQCRIWVEDNGIGFDEQYLTQVFQPFQRLVSRDDYEGTGMGLAICQKIVERHGGNITAQSSVEKGATFIITLPMQQPTQETVQWPNGESQSQY